MSTTEWMTAMSDVPTNGPKVRWPEAIGETMVLGMPSGSSCITAAARTNSQSTTRANRWIGHACCGPRGRISLIATFDTLFPFLFGGVHN